MGGFGSGRRSGGGRQLADSCRSLDINDLHRKGCLVSGSAAHIHWSRGDDCIASIEMRFDADRLRLSYRHRFAGGEWEDIEEPISIVHVPCRFGGTRPYFICPGIVNGRICGRRVAKLFGPGRYFLCRHCYRLVYSSQNEGQWDRWLRRANKIRIQLGGAPGMNQPFPPRPKGMWYRTYERLQNEALELEEMADRAFAIRAATLVTRFYQSEQKQRFWS